LALGVVTTVAHVRFPLGGGDAGRVDQVTGEK
jgi:hypothetical protein